MSIYTDNSQEMLSVKAQETDLVYKSKIRYDLQWVGYIEFICSVLNVARNIVNCSRALSLVKDVCLFFFKILVILNIDIKDAREFNQTIWLQFG